ncbi:unnamed protein product [Effrenium voratum]|nr:unnamed protein product [Effrenium voratum]
MKALLRREAREALSAKSVRTKLDWALAINKALPSPDEPGIALTTRIARLKAVKQEALAKKKATAKSLKVAQKKLKKVKAALTMLSDEDLTHAVTERQAAAKAAAKASARP